MLAIHRLTLSIGQVGNLFLPYIFENIDSLSVAKFFAVMFDKVAVKTLILV